MFEQRIAALEGAEAARATASGMAAVTAAMVGQVQAGDHVVAARALFGSCRWVVEDLLPRFGVGCTFVDGMDLTPWQRGGTAGNEGLPPRDAVQPEPPDHRHRRGRRHRPRGRCDADRRQRFRDAALPEAPRARRGLRRLFGDQAHRRTGPMSRRRHPGLDGIHRNQGAAIPAHDRAVDLAVQCLGASERAGDPSPAGRAADRDGGLSRAMRSHDHPKASQR